MADQLNQQGQPIPTVGRIVHYREHDDHEPLPAMIVHVHSDDVVNLAVWDANGAPMPGQTSIVRRGYHRWQSGPSWEWPPRI